MKVRKYPVVIEHAGANYSAYSPDLPGCAATGATPEATKRRMAEAIQIHIRGLREDDLPVPDPSSVAEFVEV
jgi:predicted RNase H-like HicB family nuclease